MDEVMPDVDPKKTIKLGELCRLLDVKERQASYVMERGFLPQGIQDSPDRGNHRCFHLDQAFWLAIVLKLKELRFSTPQAAEIADLSDLALRGITQNLGWDWGFLPSHGKLDTDHEYFLEVGDRKYVRLATTARPSQRDLFYTDWHRTDGRRKAAKDVNPILTIRVDLRQLALLLRDADWEQTLDVNRLSG